MLSPGELVNTHTKNSHGRRAQINGMAKFISMNLFSVAIKVALLNRSIQGAGLNSGLKDQVDINV